MSSAPLYKVAPTIAAQSDRNFSPLDLLIQAIDRALRTVAGVHNASRPYPAEGIPESVITDKDRRHIAALMRVNHSGEVAAQALYTGQALTARDATTETAMMTAAREETDHLAWCSRRIEELGGRKSLLNPFWYAGSFVIGALAGLAGDKLSLGFVAETEKQVGAHLEAHLRQLPNDDARTRAILETMSTDEARHGLQATQAGGIELPPPVRTLMAFTAKIMTRSAYWL